METNLETRRDVRVSVAGFTIWTLIYCYLLNMSVLGAALWILYEFHNAWGFLLLLLWAFPNSKTETKKSEDGPQNTP